MVEQRAWSVPVRGTKIIRPLGGTARPFLHHFHKDHRDFLRTPLDFGTGIPYRRCLGLISTNSTDSIMLRQIPSRNRLVAILVVLGFLFVSGCTSTPFAAFQKKNDSSASYTHIAAKKGSSSWLPSFKAPKMPWSKSEPKVSSYSRSNGTTWNRMTKTSKKWWNKTTEVLDPYPDPKPSKYASSNASEKKKTNWFTGMFQPKETKKIETLPDWLRQESPKY